MSALNWFFSDFIPNFQWYGRWALVADPYVVGVEVSLYLLLCYFLRYKLIGAPQRYAKGEEKPWYYGTVNNVAILYNYLLCILSLWCFFGMSKSMVEHYMVVDEWPLAFCTGVKGDYWAFESGFYMWFYTILKPVEFIDTILRILLQKPVIFLHVWHHATVPVHMVICFYSHSQIVMFGALFNAFVHILMYFYYGERARGKKCPWGHWITKLQLAQFGSCFLLLLMAVRYPQHCPFDREMQIVFITIFSFYLSYFVLFIHFYYVNYIKKKGKKGKKEEKKGK